jgi:outer membrane protein assembly factor BamB
LWATAISAGESPNGAWVDGVLIITGGGQDVLALDPLDGTELWRVPVGSAVRAPAIIGGYIVLGTDAGTLLSLGDQESMQPIPSSP